jgi:DNA-binding MarR family transcriptional regulator
VELTPRQSAFLELARSLLRLERRVEGVIDRALRGSHDLDLRAMFVLAALDSGARRPGELAEALNLPPPSVTRTVERLVGRELVARRRGRHDRRRVDLELTPAGRALLGEARAVLAQALADAWPDLPDARAADLAEGLARLAEGAEGRRG